MRERSLLARRDKLLREEADQPESYWWLSFADNTGFKGGCLVLANGFATAVTRTHQLGINPGGEVQGCQVEPPTPINSALLNRLLSREDIEREMGGARKWGDD